MARLVSTAVWLCFCCMLCGCTTLLQDRRNEAVRERMEIENLRLDLNRLQDRVDGIAAAQEDMFREVERLRTSREAGAAQMSGRLDDLDRSVKAVEASCDQIRAEVVDELSKRMDAALRTAAPPVRAEHGYEHVVKPGETLSEIAAAYHVTISVIVKANGLANPDALRAGQRLFIPE